jgi:hypothetical protein
VLGSPLMTCPLSGRLGTNPTPAGKQEMP